MISATEALKHYNSQYKNATYRAVQVALVRDLTSAYQASEPKLLEIALRTEPILDILNLLTDVCLEIVGHPDLQGRRERLIRALADAQVSEETVRLMGQHMENFETMGSLFSADFENATLVLLKIQALNIHAAAQLASVLHSVAGNAAHELLCATDALLQLTSLLLKGESSETYKLEKLQKAERYLAYAKEHLLVPASKTFAPYKTLLLSADKTYLGMVTGHEANGSLLVSWYKWGYASSDVIHDWLHASQIPSLTILSPEDCSKRFGGLPPTYGKE
jgi:hypothetical protein